MCFSAAASFGVAAILLPAGIYCVRSALVKNRALLGLAVLPIVFSVQQFSEGLVWRGLDRDNIEFSKSAAYVFLYFALSFWPFWIPLCAFLTEPDARKRWLLAIFVVLGILGGSLLYVPLLIDRDSLILSVHNHSIVYDITNSLAFRAMSIGWWQATYVVIIGIPLLIAPSRGFIIFGMLLIVAATISHILFWQSFISIWCFFAAILSLLLCVSFWQLPTTR